MQMGVNYLGNWPESPHRWLLLYLSSGLRHTCDPLSPTAGPIASPENTTSFAGHWHLAELMLPWLQARGLPARIVAITCVKELDAGVRLLDALLHRMRTLTQTPCSQLASRVHIDVQEPVADRVPAAGIRMNDLNFGRVSYDPFRSYKVHLRYETGTSPLIPSAQTREWNTVTPVLLQWERRTRV